MKKRPRCFVAMPMSDVSGVATKAEWEGVYRSLFVSAIRAAGFEATRSTPTRGNLVAGIIDDLWSADAVLADLTGKKPNVFYELGVRHALRGKTIIVARDQEDIPFDIRSYACHTYDPKTARGRAAFWKTVRKLLTDVLENPDRPDNPVEDFLQDSKRIHGTFRFSNLTLPQRKACISQMHRCEATIAEISRGRVCIPTGTAEYFHYFLELIEMGDKCESVRVFLSKMQDNSLRYNEATAKPLFTPFKRAVTKRNMRIEYTCLFESRKHFKQIAGWKMLERHCWFAYSVRKAFLDEIQRQPIPFDKTIVLLENRRWAITHTWDCNGIIENPILFTEEHEFDLLRKVYEALRSHSYAYRSRLW